MLYTQQLLGWSALKSGLSQLPMGLVLMAVAGMAGPLTERVGSKAVLVAGLATFTAGLAWYAQVPVRAEYLTDLLGPSLVVAVGLGLAFVALTVSSVAGVDDDHLGLAGGLINTTQQLGGAIGLAVVTAVVESHHPAAGPVAAHAGFAAGLRVSAAIAGAATILATLVLPAHARGATLGAPVST